MGLFLNMIKQLKILFLVLESCICRFCREIPKQLFFERIGFMVKPIVIKSNFDAAVTMNNNSGINKKKFSDILLLQG